MPVFLEIKQIETFSDGDFFLYIIQIEISIYKNVFLFISLDQFVITDAYI